MKWEPTSNNPLYELLDTLGTVIHVYEEKHHPIPECSGVEVLRLLMGRTSA